MHEFAFNEAISFIVHCEDQKEIDYYWKKLSAVPESEQCGWLKDKYGVSWQIVPVSMDEMMRNGTSDQVEKVTKAFLSMKKFDVAKLKEAYEGNAGSISKTINEIVTFLFKTIKIKCMGFDQYHEPPQELSQSVRTFARLIKSLIEEAEAIDWYEQRLSVEKDEEAKKIMEHTQKEEFIHFAMDLEFLLRKKDKWRIIMKNILFRDGDIVENGEKAEAAVE